MELRVTALAEQGVVPLVSLLIDTLGGRPQ